MAGTQLAEDGVGGGSGDSWCGRDNTSLWFQAGCVLTVISLVSCRSVWVVFSAGLVEPGAVGHGGVCNGPVVWRCVAHPGSECAHNPHRLWVIMFMSLLEEWFVGAVTQVVPLLL